MKTIMMTMSRGSLIRNFFHTGVVQKLLDRGFRIILLTPDSNKSVLAPFVQPNIIVETLHESKHRKGVKIMEEILKGAIFNKTVHVRYRYRFAGPKPNLLFYPLRMILFVPLHFIPGFKPFIRWVERTLNPQKDHDYLFEKYHPDLVFLTASGRDSDISVLRSARRYGVRTVMMEKTWDTLSKMLFSDKSDYLFVWGEFMKSQAKKYQGFNDKEIVVTGVPQFDFYAPGSRFILSREAFCAMHGLDPKKPFIMYGSSGGDVCDEMDYLSLIHTYLEKGQLKDVQVLVRPHVGWAGDIERFLPCEKFPGFFVDKTAKQNDTLKDHWDISEDHIVQLANSLHHAAVCINIGSTLTLDATAAGTPVMNINFDVNPNVDPNMSTKRLYMSDYIQAMSGTDATWLTKNSDEFLRALKDICEKGETRAQERAAMVSYFMYRNDGKSAERIADALTRLAPK